MALDINYPDISKIQDPQLRQQLKLIWDVMKSIGTAVDAIPVPDPNLTALQSKVTTLTNQQNVNKDHNSLMGLQGGGSAERYHLTAVQVSSALRTAGWPAAKATRSTDQSIPTATWTAISFDGTLVNGGGMWSGASPTRLTMPVAGTYIIGAHAIFDANATASRRFGLDLNNFGAIPLASTQLITDIRDANASGGAATPVIFVTLHPCIAGDYVELKVYQDSGGNLNIFGSGQTRSPRLWAVKVCE